ncbi:hypothetical protein PAECIP111891_05796 [Paenibacillus allorhizoplanae]|uniref:Uncharacterized protein n=1 Tax=Paenibacillus allorhizoplanae TaxID=2905648 RepID=A0ABM9CXG8_9BACL|nr:hypothetical protein [Paenibacillus allorhizoplanae]CAH1225354.1 hypothetical protein PAECIP111891_05796 [Paenibacillus allorhizoplanae]
MGSIITLIVFAPIILFLVIGILPNSRNKNRPQGRRGTNDSSGFATYDSMDFSSNKSHHHNHHHHGGHSDHGSHGNSHDGSGDSGGGDSGGGDGGGGGD